MRPAKRAARRAGDRQRHEAVEPAIGREPRNTAAIRSRGARGSSDHSPSVVTSASSSASAADTRALICDTGALIDYLVEGSPDHQLFRVAIDSARTRYLPGLVLAEVDYFLREEREAMRALMDDLERGAFTYAPPTLDQLLRAMEIDRRHADLGLGLGLVDASVVALAEGLDVLRVATVSRIDCDLLKPPF